VLHIFLKRDRISADEIVSQEDGMYQHNALVCDSELARLAFLEATI
jgi:hypothetical protein